MFPVITSDRLSVVTGLPSFESDYCNVFYIKWQICYPDDISLRDDESMTDIRAQLVKTFSDEKLAYFIIWS